VSRTGFLTQLKSKKVRINRETTSRMDVGAKLSMRAVMKEQRLRWVSSTEKKFTTGQSVRWMGI